jgi:hypothetical protein
VRLWRRERTATRPPAVAPQPDANRELRVRRGWWARLEGEELELLTLANEVQLPDVDVEELDGRFYLWADAFQAIEEDQGVLVEGRAEEIVRVLNGAARITHTNHREVRVDAAARVSDDGAIKHFIHMRANLTMRGRMTAKLTVGSEQQAEPPSRISVAASRGLEEADAERALRIFGRDDADFRDLYHFFEIAEAALGGALFADGMVTKAEVERFTRTAQSPSALGDAARHGIEHSQPPAEPMPLPEARSLIGRILRAWLA